MRATDVSPAVGWDVGSIFVVAVNGAPPQQKRRSRRSRVNSVHWQAPVVARAADPDAVLELKNFEAINDKRSSGV
jgi:hypothetical protein